MSNVVRATATAIALAAALAACQSGAPSAGAPTTAGESTPPAPERTTSAPVAPKAQRPADPPSGPNPCDGISRAGGNGPTRMGSHTTAELYLVRVERRACSDLVVFRVNGTAGFGGHVEYVTSARAARSGEPVEVRGGAVLEIVVFAPDFAYGGGGHQPGRTPWKVGQEVASVPSGWSALREVAYAGANDGSETVFAVGVRERLPFTLTWRKSGSYSEVSLEIAHRTPSGG